MAVHTPIRERWHGAGRSRRPTRRMCEALSGGSGWSGRRRAALSPSSRHSAHCALVEKSHETEWMILCLIFVMLTAAGLGWALAFGADGGAWRWERGTHRWSGHCSLPLPCLAFVPSLTSGILPVSPLLATLLRSFPLLPPSSSTAPTPIASSCQSSRSLFRNVSSHHPIPVPNVREQRGPTPILVLLRFALAPWFSYNCCPVLAYGLVKLVVCGGELWDF